MARRRKRRKKKQIGFSGILLFLFLIVVCAAAIFLASRRFVERDGDVEPAGEPAAAAQRPAVPPRAAPPPRETAPPHGEAVVEPEGEPPPPAAPLPADGALVAVVIDDLGRSLADLETLGRLGVPLTYAVLPFETRTGDVVRELRRQGREIFLHLPMEAENGANPGPGALERAMSERELVRRTRQALAAVPGAVGVNNHMGSGFSADPRSMRPVLGVVAERGLCFLDSRTTAETVGYRLATELGIPAAERKVFLDRDPDPEAVRGEFRRLLAAAREEGSAIAIGHPHEATLDVLAEEIPQALDLGYQFVPASYLLRRTGGLLE